MNSPALIHVSLALHSRTTLERPECKESAGDCQRLMREWWWGQAAVAGARGCPEMRTISFALHDRTAWDCYRTSAAALLGHRSRLLAALPLPLQLQDPQLWQVTFIYFALEAAHV